MLAVAGVVLVISMGWRFSGYLSEAASGLITRDVLFLVMAYRLPGFLELIIPISFFLAIMLAYGRLYADSEMVVLQSCGMSPRRLIFLTLALSILVMVVTAVLSLWLKPVGEGRFEKLFTDQRNLTEFDTLVPGRFQSLRSGKRVTYTEKMADEGNLRNLFINEYQESNFFGPKDVVTIVAESGESIVDANGNRILVLRDGTRYNGKPGTNDFRVIEFDEYGQRIEKEEDNFQYHRRAAIPTRDLLETGTSQHISELHWRIGVILMVPVIAVMAIPLSRVNPRQGRFTRLLPGMLCCFLYVICLSAARSAIEKEQLPVALGLWWVHGIFILIVWLMFYLDRLTGFLTTVVRRRAAGA